MTNQTEKYFRYPVDGYQPRLPKSQKRLIGVADDTKNSANGSRQR